MRRYVPIAETIGATPFATTLTQKTNGKAFVSYAFDHWSVRPGKRGRAWEVVGVVSGARRSVRSGAEAIISYHYRVPNFQTLL